MYYFLIVCLFSCMVIDAIEGEQYVNFQEQAQAEGKCP
jgi:hypothetical protein